MSKTSWNDRDGACDCGRGRMRRGPGFVIFSRRRQFASALLATPLTLATGIDAQPVAALTVLHWQRAAARLREQELPMSEPPQFVSIPSVPITPRAAASLVVLRHGPGAE